MPSLVETNSNTTATVYTAASEIAAITSTDPTNTLDAVGQGVTIMCTVALTPGTTGGTVSAKVRQGVGLGGNTVATIPLSNTVAATPWAATFIVNDPTPLITGPGNSGLPIYTVTLTVAGSNGTGVYAAITTIINADEN
jgi:hypothetical protein